MLLLPSKSKVNSESQPRAEDFAKDWSLTMLFLQYILKQDRQSMMYMFLETQMKNRKPRDCITQVLKDIKELHLNKLFACLLAS